MVIKFNVYPKEIKKNIEKHLRFEIVGGSQTKSRSQMRSAFCLSFFDVFRPTASSGNRLASGASTDGNVDRFCLQNAHRRAQGLLARLACKSC